MKAFVNVILFCIMVGETSNLYAQKPINSNATKETVSLFNFLYNVAGHNKNILFGHEDELVSTSTPKKSGFQSDIYDLISEYPVVYGYDLSNIEVGKKKNFSGVSLDSTKKAIIYAYNKGGIITVIWAAHNPVMPQENVKSMLVTNTINGIFSDPVVMNRYNSWLDTLSVFFKSLKGDRNELIPVLFRPFHENNGKWFWWGGASDNYVKLWKYTVDYLTNHNKINNLLFAYSTDQFKNAKEYLANYPGDNYVDVLGFDCYDYDRNYPGDKLDIPFKRMIQTVTDLAAERKKIPALTETGMQKMDISDWWTNTLYKAINGSNLSYVLIWGNYNKDRYYWGPYKGQISENDFIKFSKYKNIIFQSRISYNEIYRNN